MSSQRGFTLLEVLIAVALVAIISTVGYQAYTGYIDTANSAVLQQNIDSMRVFQEDVRLRTGSYGEGTYDFPNGVSSLTTATGWRPDDRETDIVYVVDTVGSGAGYTATATTPQGDTSTKCFGDGCP